MNEYEEGARVQFTIDGSLRELLTGTVRGVAYTHIVRHYIVIPDKQIKEWPYSAVCVQDSFMRRIGENRSFGCELK